MEEKASPPQLIPFEFYIQPIDVDFSVKINFSSQFSSSSDIIFTSSECSLSSDGLWLIGYGAQSFSDGGGGTLTATFTVNDKEYVVTQPYTGYGDEALYYLTIPIEESDNTSNLYAWSTTANSEYDIEEDFTIYTLSDTPSVGDNLYDSSGSLMKSTSKIPWDGITISKVEDDKITISFYPIPDIDTTVDFNFVGLLLTHEGITRNLKPVSISIDIKNLTTGINKSYSELQSINDVFYITEPLINIGNVIEYTLNWAWAETERLQSVFIYDKEDLSNTISGLSEIITVTGPITRYISGGSSGVSDK